ncbi:hypothetical protein ACIQLJ_02200 [Microbacterium sp. NPDC091313]
MSAAAPRRGHIAEGRRMTRAGHARGRSAASALLVAAASVAAGLLVAAAGAAGTYAYLAASANVASAATIRAGSASVVVTSALALPGDPLYPGRTVTGAAVIRNAGDVPLTLRVDGLTPPAASIFAASVTVGASLVSSAGACTSAVTPSWSGTFASSPAGTLGGPLPPGASATICVRVTMPASAAAAAAGGADAAFALRVSGVQA